MAGDYLFFPLPVNNVDTLVFSRCHTYTLQHIPCDWYQLRTVAIIFASLRWYISASRLTSINTKYTLISVITAIKIRLMAPSIQYARMNDVKTEYQKPEQRIRPGWRECAVLFVGYAVMAPDDSEYFAEWFPYPVDRLRSLPQESQDRRAAGHSDT